MITGLDLPLYSSCLRKKKQKKKKISEAFHKIITKVKEENKEESCPIEIERGEKWKQIWVF